MMPKMTISKPMCLAMILTLSLSLRAGAEGSTGEAKADSPRPPTAILKQFCVECHNEKIQKADLRLDDIRAEESDLTRWEKVLEMVSIGDMPPDNAQQPLRAQREQLTKWIRIRFKSLAEPDALERAFPRYANRMDHDELFSGKHKGPAFTASRVWRISTHIYGQLMKDLELRDFTVPLTAMAGEGFDDYSVLYADEATIRTMMQNAKRVATTLVHGRLIVPRGAAERNPNNKPHRTKTRHVAFAEFAALESAPTKEQQEAVVRHAFKVLLQRTPDEAELTRYIEGSLAPNVEAGGVDAGLNGFLVTMLLSPEYLFRMEMGLGKRLADGRRRLSPHELAYALSFALYDHPIDSVLKAADQGKLSTREDVEREFRTLLENQKLRRGQIPAGRRDRSFWPVGKLGEVDKPRLLRFFQEFFDYEKAKDVFKDDFRHGGVHDPRQIVQDADWFVLRVLADDRDVLKQLLTSDRYFVVYGKTRRANKIGYAAVYNMPEPGWSTTERVAMPKGQRAGMLTHPAWLVAHSGNFENDPVRRGKWIQEHLLCGVVPDIPIGVEAQLPEAPHQTLRKKFDIVRAEECWRCHRKMNPLGEPFEVYDDFGRFRTKHHVTPEGVVLASDLELNRNRRTLTAEPLKPVDSSGNLIGTGDPELDGEVKDAVDLLHRLAKSTRVRQSFIRHVFRFWMGRNETLVDSPTLIAMDWAYVESGGSLKETLVALITSDSFLMRK